MEKQITKECKRIDDEKSYVMRDKEKLSILKKKFTIKSYASGSGDQIKILLGDKLKQKFQQNLRKSSTQKMSKNGNDMDKKLSNQ